MIHARASARIVVLCALLAVAVIGVIADQVWPRGTSQPSLASDWPAPIVDRAPLAQGALARITGVVNFHVGLPNGAGTMRFESQGRTVDTPITQNRFVVDLPQGTWSQRSLDGRICDQPFVVGDQPGPNDMLGGTGIFTGVQYEGRFEGCTPLATRP